MNDGQIFQSKPRSVDNSHFPDLPMRFYQHDARAAETKPLFLEPVYDIKSLIENPPFLQSQFPFMTHSKNVKETEFPNCTYNASLNTENCPEASQEVSLETSFKKNNETSINDYVEEKKVHLFRSSENAFVYDAFSCLPSSNQHFGNEYSSSKKNYHMPMTTAFLSSKPEERILSIIEENEQIKNNLSSENDKYQAIPNTNVLNAARQLLAISKVTKDEKILPITEENEQIKNDFSLSGTDIYQSFPNANILSTAHQLLAISGVAKDEKILPITEENEQTKNDVSLSCTDIYQSIPNANILNAAHQLLAISDVTKDEKILPIAEENEQIKNDFSLSGTDIYQSIPNANIMNAAHQLLAISHVRNSQVEGSGSRFQNEGISLNGLRINRIDMNCSSGESGRDLYIENTSLLNTAIQLLAVSELQNPSVETSQFIDENETLSSGSKYKQLSTEISNDHLAISKENNTEILKTDLIKPLPMNDISEKYWQFYKQTSPQDYDFAMNLMAYIEALNDSEWHATITNFDEIVKNMVRYLWNQVKNTANSNILLDGFYQDDFINVMEYFTEFTYKKEYQLGEFLQYCILMCQLGVLARNRNFKEAPLYVIDYLQKGISKIEHEESVIFEIDIKKYARKFYKMM